MAAPLFAAQGVHQLLAALLRALDLGALSLSAHTASPCAPLNLVEPKDLAARSHFDLVKPKCAVKMHVGGVHYLLGVRAFADAALRKYFVSAVVAEPLHACQRVFELRVLDGNREVLGAARLVSFRLTLLALK